MLYPWSDYGGNVTASPSYQFPTNTNTNPAAEALARCNDNCFDTYLLDICDKFRLTLRARQYGQHLINHFLKSFGQDLDGESKENIKEWVYGRFQRLIDKWVSWAL